MAIVLWIVVESYVTISTIVSLASRKPRRYTAPDSFVELPKLVDLGPR